MRYFLMYHPAIGRKTVQGASRDKAIDTFMRNTGRRLFPTWVIAYKAAQHETVKQGLRLGLSDRDIVLSISPKP